ncbi:MAG TPA: aldehyde dehydrogenase family protein [Ligilactobacillus acidipiscis]|uniref:Aldehyde dehydrogenase family protein n=1 Tax=Ligilactobacillus acidipiscis TaxID=89059 RepID=A0A921FCM3_9LACO|nr:aldehyde dehydrogenase family protein [Ligilactobacillus acidipiscis]
MSYTAVNPYTGQKIRSFENVTDQQLEMLLDQAQGFYEEAQKRSVEERTEFLNELADEFENNTEKYARILSTNMGKLIAEARQEVVKTVSFARYYAKNGVRLLKPQPYTDLSSGQAQVEFSGTGIVLAIEPWNFPYAQVMRVFAPNFVLGDPVILKHASIVPEAALAFQEACDNAGLPLGAFTNIFASYDQVDHIIEDPRVQGVALTGSEGAGRKIAASAGKNLTKSTLELGGTDVFVVLDDVDIDAAAKDAAKARLTNAGQVCTAAKRYIVSAEVYPDFLAALKDEFAKYHLGDPLDEKTTLAPLSSKSAQKQLQEQVEKVIAGGAEVLFGDPTPNKGKGAGFSPLILSGMDESNPMYEEELFGPVAQIYQAHSDDEVVKIANNSRHGLGGAVYTKDVERGKKIASRIETGQVTINQILSSQSEVPFGGVKDSGYGRELSDWGIYEFANIKPVIY